MWFFSFILLAFSETPRISQIHKNLQNVDLILVSPGLVSVIEFPKPILEVRVGNSEILSTSISTVSPKELTLSLNRLNVATNLIVKSGNRVFVFDVVSNANHHQDYLKVSSGYSSPNFNEKLEVLEQRKFDFKLEKPIPKTSATLKKRVYIK